MAPAAVPPLHAVNTRIFYKAVNPQVRNVLEGAGLLTGYITGLVRPPETDQATRQAAAASAPAGAVVPVPVTAPKPA